MFSITNYKDNSKDLFSNKSEKSDIDMSNRITEVEILNFVCSQQMANRILDQEQNKNLNIKYNEGLNEGYNVGYNEGYSGGYNDGYSKGCNDFLIKMIFEMFMNGENIDMISKYTKISSEKLQKLYEYCQNPENSKIEDLANTFNCSILDMEDILNIGKIIYKINLEEGNYYINKDQN